MLSASAHPKGTRDLARLGEELRHVSVSLWRSVSPLARWQMSGILTLVVLGSAFQALSPLALKATVDGLSNGLAGVVLPVLAYVGLIGAARVAPAIAGWGYQVSSRRVERALSLRAHARLLDLPHAFFLKNRSGEMTRTVSDGVSGSTIVLGALLFSALPFVVEVGIAFAVLAASSFPWSITLVLVAFIIGYGVVFERGIAGQRAAYRDAIKDNAAAAGVAHDAFANHEAVKLFARERYVLDHVAEGMARSDGHWFRFSRMQGLTGAAQGLIVAAAMGCTLLLAGREVAAGRLTLGDFVLVNAYVLQVMGPVERLGHLIREVTRGLDMAGRLRLLLKEPSESELSPGRAALPAGGALSVEVRGLRFGYNGERDVLRGIDLDIPAGRTLAVVGRSGSGKSTLARLFFRLYPAGGGQIALDGIPVEDLDLRELRGATAVVPQETVLLHDTLRRNVAFGRPDASLEDIEAAATTAGLDRVVAMLPEGWETIVGERGLRLSGGERQRVAIARALLKSPRLLVLDEATASLDTRTEREVQARLDLLARGTTTLVIAHRLSTVRQADEIVVLEQGEIVERGRHDELLQRDGLYASLWRAQNEEGDGSGLLVRLRSVDRKRHHRKSTAAAQFLHRRERCAELPRQSDRSGSGPAQERQTLLRQHGSYDCRQRPPSRLGRLQIQGRIGTKAQLLPEQGFGLVQTAEPIDQLSLQCLPPGPDPAAGDGENLVFAETAPGADNPQELSIGVVEGGIQPFHLTLAISDKGRVYRGVGSALDGRPVHLEGVHEADEVDLAGVDADRTGEGGRMRDDARRMAGDPVAAGCRISHHADHHGLAEPPRPLDLGADESRACR